MVGQDPASERLETDWVLVQFGPARSRAQAGYAAFVRLYVFPTENMAQAFQSGIYSVREIAAYCVEYYSSVRRAVRPLETRKGSEPESPPQPGKA